METYETFQDAYLATLSALLNRGEAVESVMSARSVGSGFGKTPRPFHELRGEGFCLRNPRARDLLESPRNPSVVFNAANLIFTLAGGHEVEMITAYNERGRQFAEDGSRYESSFGARLFSPGHQLAHVKRKIEEDRLTRRALAMIYNPEDTLVDGLDTPCAIALEFLVRQNALHCICFMRSQSAAMVMPYDVYLFTMIQEWLAVELGTDLGTYTHIAGSLHYYEEERAKVEAIVAGGGFSPLMPEMTSAGPDVASRLIGIERRLRLTGQADEGCLDSYWTRFMAPIVDWHREVLRPG